MSGIRARLWLVRDASNTGDRKRALKEVFLLNDELGRLARAEPSIAATLVQVQVSVNSVTVALKSGDAGAVSRGLESADTILEEMERR